MRKFNCWNISIVQQYARRGGGWRNGGGGAFGRAKESRIRSAVFGNSRQFFLMRQNDRADLDGMGRDIGLIEADQARHPLLAATGPAGR